MNTDQVSYIADELRAFISERFNVPADDADFNDDTHLFNYGYVDSFGAVDLTAFVESKFSTRISESDLIVFPLNTIREISTFVASRINQNR